MDPWRLILDPPQSGVENMAVDEAILRTMEAYVEEGAERMPTIRLYSWLEPTVSIGYRQDAGPFINLVSADGWRVPFVRRITGGRAVLHESEITYSLVCPASHPLFSRGIEEAYRVVSVAIAGALNESGVLASFERGSLKRARGADGDKDACFLTTSRYEVVAGSNKSDGGLKKIAGSSQRRFKGAFLQHGSILLEVDKALTRRVFGNKAAEGIASVSDFKELSPDAVDMIRTAFVEQLGTALDAEFTLSKLSASERNLTRDLIEDKYSSNEWNAERAGR
jgi:lipoate-protein ligase A